MTPSISALVLMVVVLFSFITSSSAGLRQYQRSQPLSGKLSISGAWALYPLVARWTEQFQKKNPSVRIDLQAGGAGKGVADVLAGLVDIGMVSREVYAEELTRGAAAIAVARDAVVVTLNQKNPFLKLIQEKGISRQIFQAIWIEGRIKFWEEIFGFHSKTQINVYTRSDACGAAETWASFLGAHQENLRGVAIYGDPGLAEAVRRDPAGIGFNNLNFAFDPRTRKPHIGLAICPFDLNGNGRIEPEENFYEERDHLILAISSRTYPSPPARDLYLVIKRPLSNLLIIEFLRWILEEGQNLVEDCGYVAMDKKAIEAEKEKLSNLAEHERN